MATNSISIRIAQEQDFDGIWEIFHHVVSAGDSYVYAPSTTKDEAYVLWCNDSVETYVAIHEGQVVGTYIIKPNFPGAGAHVANASYMVSPSARGLGIGRLLGVHSITKAQESGYLAMQFKIVVSTNVAAIRLWQSLGFAIIGTSPKAFMHPSLAPVLK